MRKTMLAACLFLVAAEPLPSPDALRQEISADGAKKTVDKLDAAGQLDGVFAQIGAGSNQWVAIAPLLAPGTDGSAALGIRVTLARALLRNPTAVLQAVETDAADHRIGLRLVCGIPFIEPTPSFVVQYRQQATAALAAVHGAALASRRDECIASLKANAEAG